MLHVELFLKRTARRETNRPGTLRVAMRPKVPPQLRREFRNLFAVKRTRRAALLLALVSLQAVAACGTTRSSGDTPLPSVPSYLLEQTPAPALLKPKTR